MNHHQKMSLTAIPMKTGRDPCTTTVVPAKAGIQGWGGVDGTSSYEFRSTDPLSLRVRVKPRSGAE